ncbi:MAG: helix-turn-helix domain-containing protein [Flavobacterium sp.]|nr:MAG: helix-turn-helix domain-containing protein [Flavobacterium sp.]
MKSATGQSVSQVIREIRLDEALKILQKEEMTASEVAYKVGFNSPTYFNTCFHAYFGYPPGEAQLQMELAKSSSKTEEYPIAHIQRTRMNKRLPIWLTLVILVVLSFFAFKYFSMDNEEPTNTSEEIKKSIAVLPLKNWSGDVELEYVSDGMTDAIISKLAEIEDIDRVIPFTSMIRYKDSQKDLQEIATELNVAFILEGNFKLSGEQVQSNLKLIEASSLEQVWAMEYTGAWKSNEIFKMQSEVAQNVANTLSADIATNEMTALDYQPTESEEAYRVYLKAEYQLNKLSKFGLTNAIGLYEEAISLDSTYVEPYIGLATAYLVSGAVWGLIPEQEAWNQSKPLFEKALVLDSLASGRNSTMINLQLHGGIFYYELDLPKVERQILLSLSNKDEISSENLLFDYARKTGRLDYSLKLVKDELKINPTDGLEYMQMAFLHFMKGDTRSALALLEKYDPLYQDNYFYLLETSKWYYYMGEIEKSKQHLTTLMERHEDRPPIVFWLLAVHSEIEGDENKLKSNLATLNKQYQNLQSGSPAWFLALFYFHTGETDKAFDWLQKSYERREVEMTWLKEEPMLKEVQYDPRYIELYEKMGFQHVGRKLIE